MKKWTIGWFREVLSLKKQSKEETETEKLSNAYNTEFEKPLEISQPLRPYKSARLVGNTAIVVDLEGNILEKLNCTTNDWYIIKNAINIREVEFLVMGKSEFEKKEKEEDEIEEVAKTLISFSRLTATGQFEEKDGSLYMKDSSWSIPSLLANKFASTYGTEEFDSLKNFWFWLCLNPNPTVVSGLFDFLSKHTFKINKYGCFFAYRRVVSVDSKNKDYIDFVTNAYNKIKSWKKSPKNFWIYTDVDGSYNLRKLIDKSLELSDYENLADAYDNLGNVVGKTYTDNHTRTYDYRPNTTISMPREDCDSDGKNECSYGLNVKPLN